MTEAVERETQVRAPMDGMVMALENVPDPAFAGKMLGEGVAILPTSGRVVSPVDGQVVALFPTGHAVGLLSSDGWEILIHVGVETVTLVGCFRLAVRQGDHVRAGDLLLEFDLGAIRSRAPSALSPVVVGNLAARGLEALPGGPPEARAVRAGVDVLFSLPPAPGAPLGADRGLRDGAA